MNRKPLYFLAFVLLLASCQREMEGGGAPDIRATVEEQPETKTSLSVNESGAGTIYWNPADKIDVFFGTTRATYTSQNSSNAKTAVFKTSDSVGFSELSSTNIWGLYPSNSSSSCSGSSVTTTLPSTQYGVPNTFDDDLFLAVAHSTSTSLQFYNVCGGIKFSLYRDDITSITFRGNNNEYLAGKIQLTFPNGLPKATVVNGSKEITLIPKQGQTFDLNVNYYIITLPATLSKGFKMTFTTKDGTVGTFNYTDASVTIRRSVFSKKEWLDSFATFGGGSDFYTSVDLGQFTFSSDGDCLQVAESYIYEAIGLNKEVFERLYPSFNTAESGAGFDVTFDSQNGVLQWRATADWIWNNAVDVYDAPGEHLTTEVYFTNPNSGAKVTVILYAMPAIIQPYKIPIDRYIANYWTDDFCFTTYGVRPPAQGETDNTKCVFLNSINDSFVRNKTGIIDLTGIGMEGLEVSCIQYFFCKDMERITKIADIEVAFRVSADGDHLYANVGGVEECIAWIDNENTDTEGFIRPNVVVLNKQSNIAKLLLNTCPGLDARGYPISGEFYILLGAKGIILDDDGNGFEVSLFWPDKYGMWLDHFAAKYYQPIYLSGPVSGASFIDRVGYGEAGSYLRIEDIVSPCDWQGRIFSDYENLWGYYGPFEVLFDLENVQCNLYGQIQSLPSTFELSFAYDLPVDTQFGLLTFTNNGYPVEDDFELYVPVRVRYGWGEIEEVLTIPVQASHSSVPISTISIDGSFDDWAALSTNAFVSAKNNSNSPWNAVNEIRCYADANYVYYYIEFNNNVLKEELKNGSTLPLRLCLNTDGEFTSGFSNYFLESYDFIIEGYMADGAGSWATYDGELHQRVTSWVSLLKPGSNLVYGKGSGNKYEIMLNRELFNSVVSNDQKMGDVFYTGLRFYGMCGGNSYWGELSNMPNSSIEEGQGNGWGHLMRVTTVK